MFIFHPMKLINFFRWFSFSPPLLWKYSEWIRLFSAFGLSVHIIYLWPLVKRKKKYIYDHYLWLFIFSATRGHLCVRFCHWWIALVLPIVTVGHSIGYLCYGSYLSIFIAVMEEMCPGRQGVRAFESFKACLDS